MVGMYFSAAPLTKKNKNKALADHFKLQVNTFSLIDWLRFGYSTPHYVMQYCAHVRWELWAVAMCEVKRERVLWFD